jgi:hypothetical protein
MSGTFPAMVINNFTAPFALTVAGGANVQENLCCGLGVTVNGNVSLNSGPCVLGGEVFSRGDTIMNGPLGFRAKGINGNQLTGIATLIGGTTGPIVNTVVIVEPSFIFIERLQLASPASNTGHLAYTVSGSSNNFTINSSNALDNGQIQWYIIGHS